MNLRKLSKSILTAGKKCEERKRIDESECVQWNIRRLTVTLIELMRKHRCIHFGFECERFRDETIVFVVHSTCIGGRLGVSWLLHDVRINYYYFSLYNCSHSTYSDETAMDLNSAFACSNGSHLIKCLSAVTAIDIENCVSIVWIE